ncbi:hypothetical protein [Burkholderia gladioli]|uniref:hypothetical protein n=1 Tax=Burkholderia gladioli TaxID=28095 RepID=UPI00164092CE|nr:hypothetical protein [Burkholderia gladioli]
MKKNAPPHGRQFAATAFFEQKSSIFHPANPGAGKIRMKIRIHITRQCHSAFISESTRPRFHACSANHGAIRALRDIFISAGGQCVFGMLEA